MNASVRPFWPPLAAGLALGAVLFATFLVTGHGLGASGSFTGATAWLGGKIAPEIVRENGYLGPMLAGNPLAAWISWEVLGVLVGGLCLRSRAGAFVCDWMDRRVSAPAAV